MLLGDGDQITDCIVAENVADDPLRRFEIDPAALFAALKSERAGGPKLLGYWHSHPSGDARPSAMDAGSAEPDGKLWIIVADDDVRAWRASDRGIHGRFNAVDLVVRS